MSTIPLVALQVRPPADVTDRVRNVVSLRDMMNQSQRVQKDQKIWQEAYRTNNGDPDKTAAQAIKNGASPESVQTFQQRQAILKQQIAQRDELELRNFNTRMDNLRGVLKPNADLAHTGGEALSHEAGHEAQPTPPTPMAPEDPDRIPGTFPEQDPQSLIEGLKQGRQAQNGWPQPGSTGQTGQMQQGQTQGGQTGQAATVGTQSPSQVNGSFQLPRGWTPRKQQVWSEQRRKVLLNPPAYGISDPRQIPEQYPGDDFILDQYATLGGGQQLVQQDLRRRQSNTAPEGTMINTSTGVRIKQNGAWVPYSGK